MNKLLSVGAVVVIAGCGGGGAGSDDGLSAEIAQGYAADGVAMPVSAAGGAESAAGTLESALAGSGALATIQSVQPLASASATASCFAGGTVSWTVTAGSAATIGNGRFDSGESYSVSYATCGSANGDTLNGSLTLTVNARTDTTLDLTLASDDLRTTNALGSFTSDGSWRHARTTSGNQRSSRITSSGLAVASRIDGRSASYELRSLDWTIVRTLDSNGNLLTRTHQGALDLATNTPRRPNVTLQVTTQGTLAVGADGLASSGSFRVVTSDNAIACTYGNGTTTLTLDIGNNGSIDRTWTLTRTVFNGSAG